MLKKLALLPVDARPVTRELPVRIAEVGGWEVRVPEPERLGFLKEPGDVEALREWLFSMAGEVDGFVVSADMLGYGGLVPSRINEEAEAVIRERMGVLKQLKARYPEKKLMAFSATMRISNNYVNEEEKAYWSEYGEELWAYSYHSHRFEKTGSAESKGIMDGMCTRIPEAVLQDYVQTRRKNFNVNLSLLALVEAGVLDLLVFPQDDTAQYGLNIREQEQLAAEIALRSLYDRVLIYPGADEVAAVLVARMIFALEQRKPPVFYPIYSGEKGALSAAMYEDRPLMESVKGQIHAFGSYTVHSPGEADVILGVNVPGKQQGDLALQKNLREVDTPDRNIGEWLQRLMHYGAKGKPVAVADTAYANGADPALLPRMLESLPLHKLAGFAAWNTAGNTIGTVVAMAGMVHLSGTETGALPQHAAKKLEQLLVLRMLDDYVYQTVVRQAVRRATDDRAANLEETVRDFFQREAALFLEKYGKNLSVERVDLPWKRSFEIGIKLKGRGSGNDGND